MVKLFSSLYSINPAKLPIHTLLGLFVTAIFIGLNSLSQVIAIGIPSPLATFGGTFVVVVILAGMVETFLFAGVFYGLANGYFKRRGTDRTSSLIISAIILSIIFSIFHMQAYGGFRWASASFVGAFIFSMAMIFITEWRKDLWPATVMHMAFNAYLLATVYLVLAI